MNTPEYATALDGIALRLQNLNHKYHSCDAGPSRHIVGMYERAVLIAQDEQLSPHDLNLLFIAVLLHDIEQGPGHEAESAKTARDIMESFGYTEEDQNTVAGAIESTKILRDPDTGKLYRKPVGKISEILLDCDIFANALPQIDFFNVNAALRAELGREEDSAWWLEQIKFMEEHEWFTPFARQYWDPQKQANLSAVRQKLSEALLTNVAA